MTNEWMKAMYTAMEAVENETLEALKRDANEKGFMVETEDKLEEYKEYFLKGLEHAFKDMKKEMCRNIDNQLKEWFRPY